MVEKQIDRELALELHRELVSIRKLYEVGLRALPDVDSALKYVLAELDETIRANTLADSGRGEG